MYKWGTAAVVMLVATACATTPKASVSETATARADEIMEAATSRMFTVSVNTANTRRGRTVPVTSDFRLRVCGDSVFSYLPYFGRAYSVQHGGGKGLNFDSRVADYTVRAVDKGTVRIEFRTRTDEDVYRYRIEVGGNGSATIYVRAQQRDDISFDGDFAR